MIEVKPVRAQLSLKKLTNIGGEEGKNSEVWLALDTQLDQELILKKITKKSLDRQLVDDYFTEAKILNNSKHPHIMPIYYSAEDENHIYITMPYYKKGSLNSIIQSNFFTAREIIKYSLDFLSGLLFIHIKGLLHLDIKPSNIIINDVDRAVITDFGLSKYLNEHGFAEQSMFYFTHSSPEYLVTRSRTVFNDIYQAGLTMYRMCNGNNIFNRQFNDLKTKHDNDQVGILEDIQKGKFPNRNYYLPHIPRQLIKIINKMIHVNTNTRYKEVLSIINDLSKINSTLDWKFKKEPISKTYSWELETETSILTVKLKFHKGMYVSSAERFTKRSKNKQKQHKYSGTHKSKLEAFKFINSKMFS